MNKISKKVIRNTVDEAIQQALVKLDVSSPSRKTQKLVKSASKKFSEYIKAELKSAKKKVTKNKETGKKSKKITVAA
jgi:predicted RNA-binding protein Jag